MTKAVLAPLEIIRIEGTRLRVIVETEEQVELSFSRTWDLSVEGEQAPLTIDRSCGGMCIPNTMNSAIEAMGMSLPYRPHFDQLFKRTGSLYKSFEGMPKIAKPEKPSDVEEAVTKAKLLHYELVHSSDSMKITSMCFWIMRSTFSACGLCICFHSYYVGLLEAYLCLEFDYFLYLNDI